VVVENGRRGELPVSGLFFTGSFATAARGVHGHRNPGRLVRQSGSSAHCAGAGRNNDPGASDEATVRARTRIGFADLQEFTGEPRSVWPVTRGQKRVEDARRRAYDPRVHHSSQKIFTTKMDGRVKPGHDDLDEPSCPPAMTEVDFDSSCPARSQACADCVNLSSLPGPRHPRA
jgi:hypothetical protein